MASPLKHSPFLLLWILSISLVLYAFSFNFLSSLCIPSLDIVCFFLPSPSCSISLPWRTVLFSFFFFFIHVHASVFLPLSPAPSLLFLVISLSYVCPSFYVCVPPLFVSDSFSREIRDAYLVPLSSTGAAALSYIVCRWPHSEKRTCTHRVLIIPR